MTSLWRTVGFVCVSFVCCALSCARVVAQDELDDLELGDADGPQSDTETEDGADAAADETDEADASQDTDAEEEADSWTMQLSGEAGFGMRELTLPRDGLLFNVDTGVFPALGVGFQLDYHASRSVSVGLVARYQSSIGLVLSEQLSDGTQHDRKTRSHRVEVGLAPTLRLGQGGWAIAGALGYALSELDPENHLVTPSYHLAGPYLRATLQLPLGSERVRLRLGPEGHYVVQIGDELLALGVDTSGWGAGVSAALEVSFAERWTLAASYRELRFWLGGMQGARFSDASRFVTLQLQGAL